MLPPTVTPELEDSLARLLGEEDTRAYRRFIDWSLGHGFKLAIVRMPVPAEAAALAAWTHEHVPQSCQVPLDQAEGRSVWALLEEVTSMVPEASLLALTRLEECRDKRRICRELNVLRDELARQWAMPWVLVAHPGAVLELEREAPDFCDFAGLWLGRGVEPAVLPVGDMALSASRVSSAALAIAPEPAGLLGQATEAISHGRYDEATDLLAQYDLSVTEKERRAPGRLLIDAQHCFLHGDLARATVRLRETLMACGRKDSLVQGYALVMQGYIASLEGRVDEAHNLSEGARELALLLEDREAGADILRSAAALRCSLGDRDAALALLAEGLALLQGSRALANQAKLTMDKASVYAQQGHIDKALALYHEALATFEALDASREQVRIRCEIAPLMAQQGHIDEALALLRSQLGIVKNLELQYERAIVLGILANLHQQQGHFDEAQALLEEQLAFFEAQGFFLGRIAAHGQLGQLALTKREYEAAEMHFSAAYSLNTQGGSPAVTASLEMGLAAILLQRGDIRRARELLERSRGTFRQLGQETSVHAAEKLLNLAS